jgi:hypothetical protein
MTTKNYIRYNGDKVRLTRVEDYDMREDGTFYDASGFTAADATTGETVELALEEVLELRIEWETLKDEF